MNAQGGPYMTTPDPAANNTNLWATYFRAQVRTWLDPFGLAPREQVDAMARPLADMASAAVSGWVSLFAGPAVRLAYEGNKGQVNQFVNEHTADPAAVEIPAQYVSSKRYPAPTQLEEWGITSIRPERELTLVR